MTAGGIVADTWYTGNAADDSSERRGWILGSFIEPAESVRSTPDIEVKWGIHPADIRLLASTLPIAEANRE